MAAASARMLLAAAAAASLSTAAPHRPLGAEFTTTTPPTRDIVPVSLGGWTVSTSAGAPPHTPTLERRRLGDRPAATDANGWPAEDAYAIFFDLPPQAVDPAAFVPDVWGAYSLRVAAKVAAFSVPPQVNATVTDVVFDEAAWATTATVTLSPPLAGLAIGFAGTQRSAGAAAGSGFTNLTILQPAAGAHAARAAPTFFAPAALAAARPFAHIRTMQWSYGWCVVGFANASSPGLGIDLAWSGRTQMTDALWLPGTVRPTAVGAPWETTVLLAQEAGVGLWINVPVQATGARVGDDASYVASLSRLLRDGNAFTNGGMPARLPIYVEHGNEVWLNGSSAAGGGPSETYLYNRAAAAAEVALNASSSLNEDGVDDPEIWGYRRHARRVAEIGAIFADAFGQGSLLTRVRPVLGWSQRFDLVPLLAWFTRVYGAGAAARAFYGVAINAYAIGGVLAGASQADIIATARAASDAQRGYRAATAAAVNSAGLTRLLSYEGSLVVLPLNADAPTTGAIIGANRAAAWGEAMMYDFIENWEGAIAGTGVESSAFNFFALCSTFGEDTPQQIFQWGLTEDVHNRTAAKYAAAMTLLAGGGGGGG
jgi:hypothetical protein